MNNLLANIESHQTVYITWALVALAIFIISFFFHQFKNHFKPNPKMLLEGKVGSSILKFTLPIFLGMIFQQLYVTVDFIVVGQFVGKEGLAAIGLSATIVMLAVSFIVGLTMGSSIMIAQAFGAKKFDYLKQIIGTTFIAMMIGGLLSTLFGVIFANKIIVAMNTPPEIVHWATEYMQIIFLGVPILFLYNAISSILRGVGDSMTPLFYLLVTSALNILFDLFFVGLLGLGIQGAAWSTLVAQGVALFLSIRFLRRHELDYLTFRFRHLHFNFAIFKKSFNLGFPTAVQQSINMVAFLIINRIVNGFGVAAASAYALLGRIDPLIIMPAMCFGAALVTFTGQNLGANQTQRINQGLKATNLMVMGYCLIIIPLVVIFRNQLPLLFIDKTETEAIAYTADWFLYVGWAYLPFSLIWVYHGAMRGLGDSVAPMALSIFTLWLIRVPISYPLSDRFGVLGIWLAVPIAWGSNYLLTLLYWRWKSRHGRQRLVGRAKA